MESGGDRVIVVGIDPGTSESAFCLFDGERFDYLKCSNSEFLPTLHDYISYKQVERIYIEGMQSYGRVGETTFQTAYFVGRCLEYLERIGHKPEVIKRHEVLSHHGCNKKKGYVGPKSKDARIRKALIDRFGDKTKGIYKDCWSAAAIAVMAYDRLKASS